MEPPNRVYIGLYVTQAERLQLTQAAQGRGISISRLLLERCVSGSKAEADLRARNAMLAQQVEALTKGRGHDQNLLLHYSTLLAERGVQP